MVRIPPLEHDEATGDARRRWDEIVADHGRITNMKRTLAHWPLALDALLTWYPLRNSIEPFLGKRPTLIFVHAISTGTDCLICSTFFRRILMDAGEDPDHLELNPREQLLVDYGRQLVRDSNRVSNELFARLRAEFTPEQIVALTAFAGIMIATNIFNNALDIPLDDYLEPYRSGKNDAQNAAPAE